MLLKMEGVNKIEDQYQKSFKSYQKLFSLSTEDLQKSILDVGTNSGDFVHYLRNNLGNKNVYGVEKHESKVETPKDGMIIADGFKLPFGDESFEIVLAKHYLPMFVTHEGMMQDSIRELLRVAKHGGKVIGDIATPEDELKNIEFTKNLAMNDKRMIERLEERYEASKKLIEYLESLKESGIQMDKEGCVIKLYKP